VEYNSTKLSQILEQCEKKPRSTEAKVAGMPNSLLNNGHSVIYSLLAKKFGCSSEPKSSWLMYFRISHILFPSKSHLIYIIRIAFS